MKTTTDQMRKAIQEVGGTIHNQGSPSIRFTLPFTTDLSEAGDSLPDIDGYTIVQGKNCFIAQAGKGNRTNHPTWRGEYKAPSEKRSKKWNFYLTPDRFDKLQAAIKKRGISFNDWLEDKIDNNL